MALMMSLPRVSPARTGAVSPRTPTSRAEEKGSFAETLRIQMEPLRFSNHAQKRLQQRDIRLSDAALARLEYGIGKAEAKGVRSSLVLMDNWAFLVSVKDRTVITAMDAKAEEGRVFSGIDGAVVV